MRAPAETRGHRVTATKALNLSRRTLHRKLYIHRLEES